MQRYNFQFTGQRFYKIDGGKLAGQLRDVAYQATTTDFWGAMEAVGGPQTYVLGGAFNCGKGQPGQVAPVSHGCPAALFRGIRILNTVEEAASDIPQEVVERALAAARSDGCVVIAEETSSANLRWANNTLTTNGVTRSRQLTVIAIDRRPDGAASGVVVAGRGPPRPARGRWSAPAEHAAAEASPAEDAETLGGPVTDGSFGRKPDHAGTPRRADRDRRAARLRARSSARRCARPRPPAASCTGSPSTTWPARSWGPRPGCGCGTTSRPAGSS